MSPENWNWNRNNSNLYAGGYIVEQEPESESANLSFDSKFLPAELSIIHLTCADCGSDFIFSPGEQRFFARKGLDPPRRCPVCRAYRRVVKRIDSRVG